MSEVPLYDAVSYERGTPVNLIHFDAGGAGDGLGRFDNLLVRIYFITETIWWTGLAMGA